MSPQRACSGQMAVELAVLLPVVIVVALIDYNLMRFVGACAAFDHVASEQIVAQGVSPKGDAREPAVDEIRAQIEQALQMKSCEVEVTAERMVASPWAIRRPNVSNITASDTFHLHAFLSSLAKLVCGRRRELQSAVCPCT